MSLDGLRDALVREKKNEIANLEVSRKRKLRELYHYTALLNFPQPTLQHKNGVFGDELDDNVVRFLDDNDMAKGRRFDDSTLPYPHIYAHPAPVSTPLDIPKTTPTPIAKSSPSPVVNAVPSLEEQLRAASASPAVANQLLPSVVSALPRDEVCAADSSSKSPCLESPSRPLSHVAEHAVEETTDEPPNGAQQPEPLLPSKNPIVQNGIVQLEPPVDGPSVDSKDAIPPTSEDSEVLPDADAQGAPVQELKPQVVHLPPQEVQEARLRETERKLGKAAEKERKEQEKLTIPNASAPTDLVSSPSSTVGPYSQATPHAPHHSPDTSPDTETFQDHIPPQVQNDAGPDLAAEQAKEEHERALKRQMQEAGERARTTSSPTPEVERQIEDEQAIRLARDGKNSLRENEPASGAQSLTEHAEEVVAHGAELDSNESAYVKLPQAPVDSLPTPTTTAPESSNVGSEIADGISAKVPETVPTGAEHPTPPADVDVEMEDTSVPVKEQKATPQPQSCHSERITTRVSSGAIWQKSVSDIGERSAAPKPILTPRSSNVSTSTSPVRSRPRDRKAKEISTVIFAKQDANRASKALQLYNEDYASLQGASQDPSRDYLLGLFQYQAHHPPRSVPLQDLLASARKTVSTAGTLATIREAQDYKILKRVYQLQNANRWSLRQLQKSAEPPRPVCHLDHLLAEMKWMQTDFKEERRWKKALAATFADWCAEYVNSDPEVRASLRVRARVPRPMQSVDEDMKDAPTPDLIPSGANETESESFADDEELFSNFGSNPPAGIFSLGFNDVVMKIDRTPTSDAMLRELPIYEPSFDDVTPPSFCDPPIAPVSKFITGKLVSKIRGPPRKRSRYEYDSEDEPSSPPSRSGTSAEHSMPSTPGRRLYHRNDLPPEMTDVALFNPENKHVRDRLQAAHQFRPPTEFPMPTVHFFENRNSSQWLWDEDQKLRSLVKEYTFNWSLVAQELALPSIFTSGSGRRTPWECFERWVQLEGLPAEMSKTQYFRTYQTRLEQAQRTVMAQHQAQQQQLQQAVQQGQQISGQPRRRTTQPIRVERRRDNRHLAMIDGMRKLARKRESVAHKQAEAQKAAALRKAHEPAPPKTNVHTPQEFSRLKWDREEQTRKRLQMQEMTMRAMQSRQASMQGQIPNGVNQPQRTGTPNAGNVPAQMANPAQPGLPTANGNMPVRPVPGQQSMQGSFPNGNMSPIGMNVSVVPQAQMQTQRQSAQRMGPPDQVRMAMQRGQFPTTNQHQFQLQQQQINMASNLTASMGMGNAMPNANMMASMAGQNMNGNMNGSMNGMSNNAGSPRSGQVNPSLQNAARPLSSGHMPQLLQIQNTLKAQHPDWTPDQVSKASSDQLSKFLARQRAMNAATGNPGMNGSPPIGSNVYMQNGGMANSPSPNTVQNYQAQLVQQQRMISQQRQQAGSPSLNSVRPASRSATPQNPQLQQSPGMQQAQISRNQ
ncbi:hypothetical protein CC78DRAFT_545735 [Lojkania enalia]|uniref:Vacuolar import and degradation protein 21 n=1 Tax=Lojkania enalia TaxID=147567 RepID=A0A9P4N7N8_9PLEO|nr:hypothetical protein CC78DRAFT_545735 [Didymosphaeria enalia]